MKVGSVELPGNIFLAPVAGYSDAAFRSVCFGLGADLCYTEMVSSEALTRGHPKTKLLLDRAENETRYAIQLFGSRPETLAAAARLAAGYGPALIDLNCGCPVPKIVKAGAGSALMKKPELIRDIVAAMVEALGPKGPPVSVKIRSGWDEGSLNYREAADAAVEGGASAVTLHARTRAQGYAGVADWGHIRDLAARLPVPVFGSGDVAVPADAARMIAETLCAGVMIARGAMGYPHIFRMARAAMEGSAGEAPTTLDLVDAARRHLALSARFLGERTACVEFRKQFCSYTRGARGGPKLRAAGVKAGSLDDFDALFEEWLSVASH
ncbi:MAG: tRNA dihydrouridine synthase DusB [Rectinemataceae bacterium]